MVFDPRKLREQSIFDQSGDTAQFGGDAMNPPVQVNSDVMDPRSPEIQARSDSKSIVPPADSMVDLWKQLGKIYTPSTTASDRLNGLLDTIPQRTEPSMVRRIAASAMGFNKNFGPDAMQKFMDEPYNEKMEDFKARAVPFEQAAQMENAANVNERQLAGSILTASNTAEKNRIMEQRYRDEHEVSLIRANAYRAKSEGAKVTYDKGSKQIFAEFPDGHVEFQGKIPDSTTEAELADIVGGWRLRAAQATGANAAGALGADAQGNPVVINTRTGESKSVTGPGGSKGTTRMGPPVKEPTQIEKNRVIQKNFEDATKSDPIAKKWITKNNGIYVMKDMPVVNEKKHWYDDNDVWTQQDVNEWNYVKQLVDPNYKAPVRSDSQGVGSAAVERQKRYDIIQKRLKDPNLMPELRPILEKELKELQQFAGPVSSSETGSSNTVGPDEVVIEDSGGNRYAVKKSKLAEKLATGRYRQVK